MTEKRPEWSDEAAARMDRYKTREAVEQAVAAQPEPDRYHVAEIPIAAYPDHPWVILAR